MAFKIGLSACVIGFASWLSGKRPDLAGFIIALPIMTLLVLPFSHVEYQNPDNSVEFAKSIMLAVPLSLTFFIPFLLAKPIMDAAPQGYGFWMIYALGIVFLIGSYFAHKFLLKFIT